MSYQVIQSDDIEELEKRVSALLQDDWAVAGGIAVEVYHYHDRDNQLAWRITYLQAMVKA